MGAIVCELAQKGPLFDVLQASGPFEEKIALFYAQQLIQSVHYMHCQGISHKDLKPENILLDKDFNIKLADFGLSSAI